MRDHLKTNALTIAIIVPLALVAFPAYRAVKSAVLGDPLALSVTPGVMPACDSSTARRLLKQALETAPAAKQGGITVQKLGAFQETGFVPVTAKGTEMRLCSSDVFLSSGRQDVSFTLQWTSPAKTELWIEADDPF
ncbi:hypothetical protein ADL19_23505 [Streptomyces purpurogeneiscleroticus]|nr:hypothetical protein ADL19_23505 [Streptomyces purpurogeneiscleroticus]